MKQFSIALSFATMFGWFYILIHGAVPFALFVAMMAAHTFEVGAKASSGEKKSAILSVVQVALLLFVALTGKRSW